MSCSSYAQASPGEASEDSTYTPVFYGEIKGEPVFGFTYEQTKDIFQDVVNSINCDSVSLAQEETITICDSLVNSLKETITLKDSVIFLSEGNSEILELVIESKDEIIASKDNKIKWYKIKLKIIPILSAVGTAILFILVN
jgi:hypothetical protein